MQGLRIRIRIQIPITTYAFQLWLTQLGYVFHALLYAQIVLVSLPGADGGDPEDGAGDDKDQDQDAHDAQENPDQGGHLHWYGPFADFTARKKKRIWIILLIKKYWLLQKMIPGILGEKIIGEFLSNSFYKHNIELI